MNTILLHKEKNVQTKECLIDFKIGFMKSVKQKSKKAIIAEIFTS